MFNNFFNLESTSNASFVTFQLIKNLKLKITKSTVIETIETHPNYPSLFSISESLKRWKVDNIALEIDEAKLETLPVPFVAHLKRETGYFLLILKIECDSVFYISNAGKVKRMLRSQFLREWSRAVLLVQPSESSGEQNFFRKRKKERWQNFKLQFLLLSSVTMIYANIFIKPNPGNLLWVTLAITIKLAGVLITALLLWYEIDNSSPILKQICGVSGIGKNSNCSAILNSKHSKLWGLISWSELGFFYFAGGSFSLIFNGLSASPLLAWLNLIALPYIFFSIFYQWRIVKQWCRLCLSIQGLLLLEFFVNIACYWDKVGFNLGDFTFSTNFIFSTIGSFLAPIYLWVCVKKVLSRSYQTKYLTNELRKFKYDEQVFNSLEEREKEIVPPDGFGIVLGNSGASNTIIKVCNPFCNPCSNAHPLLEEIIEEDSDIKLIIIFLVPKEQDDAAEVVKHFLALDEISDKRVIKSALNYWYKSSNKNFIVFSNKYPVDKISGDQSKKIDLMHEWCLRSKITHTPTIFINNRQLPAIYRVDDLKHIFRSLIR